KTSIFSHPVYLFLRKFSLQDSRGGSPLLDKLREQYGVGGFAPIFPDTCYHLIHYRPAAVDIPMVSFILRSLKLKLSNRLLNVAFS
ncbi:hypothetical protein P4I38_23310, partial [Escherichia coli]|uniref:hypothetical protein n=2 Tax=Escherichia coli TaxID=562 RepID=UPI003CF99495